MFLGNEQFDNITVSLAKHNETLNFAFGFFFTGSAKNNIDIFDNEYFEVIAYQLTDNLTLQQIPEYELRYCTVDEMRKIR